MPDWIEISLRSLLAVVVLFIITKLLGKRQITQLSLFEYITGISIGNLAAYISLDMESPWYLGLAAIGIWCGISLGIELLTLKSKRVRDMVDGKAQVLVKNGKLLEHNLRKERLTIDELMAQMRKKSVFRIADVEFAVMEASGEVNVLLKKENQPLTPKITNQQIAAETEPQTVIMDGQLLPDALQSSGRSEQWLDNELKRRKLKRSDIFLAQIDGSGTLSVDLYRDGMHRPGAQK